MRSTIFAVRGVCSLIRSHAMDLVQAGDVLREYLYPRLEITLLYADISRKRLRKWAQLIRKAVLHHGHDLATRSIALPALFSALGVLPLDMHASLVRATEVGVMLRSTGALCADTAGSRLHSGMVARRVYTQYRRVSGKLLEVATHAIPGRRRAAHPPEDRTQEPASDSEETETDEENIGRPRGANGAISSSMTATDSHRVTSQRPLVRCRLTRGLLACQAPHARVEC